MTMDLIILTHDGAEETVKEFQPYWEEFCGDNDASLIYLCPNGHKSGFNVGPDGYKGPDAIRRFCDSLRWIEQAKTPMTIMAEYDTLPITMALPDCQLDRFNAAFTFCDYENFAALSPWVMTAPIARRVREALEDMLNEPMPEWTIDGLLDRAIGHALKRAQIPLHNIRNAIGYTGHLDNPHKYIASAGIEWVHGWKRLADFGPLIEQP